MKLPFPRLVVLSILLLFPLSAAYGEDAPLWTDEPIRIDPSKQHYERLPARKVERDSRRWVAVPFRITVLDSTSFAAGGKTYQIAGIRPVGRKRLCDAVEGGRWACGRMAAIFLGNLVRGKRLLCDVAPAGKKIMLSHCTVGTRDIATAIVTNGYGLAERDAALLAAQAEAQKASAKGLWRNPLCVTDFDRC